MLLTEHMGWNFVSKTTAMSPWFPLFPRSWKIKWKAITTPPTNKPRNAYTTTCSLCFPVTAITNHEALKEDGKHSAALFWHYCGRKSNKCLSFPQNNGFPNSGINSAHKLLTNLSQIHFFTWRMILHLTSAADNTALTSNTGSSQIKVLQTA